MEGKGELPSADSKTQFDGSTVVDTYAGEEVSAGTSQLIHIDPENEAAAFRKFDNYVLPVSVIFQVLSSLDRNNLGNARVFGFDEEIGLTGGQFGNINTLSSVCTIVFEMPWVLAVRKFGAKAALGTAFLLVSNISELVNHFYSACDSISNLCVEQLD